MALQRVWPSAFNIDRYQHWGQYLQHFIILTFTSTSRARLLP